MFNSLHTDNDFIKLCEIDLYFIIIVHYGEHGSLKLNKSIRKVCLAIYNICDENITIFRIINAPQREVSESMQVYSVCGKKGEKIKSFKTVGTCCECGLRAYWMLHSPTIPRCRMTLMAVCRSLLYSALLRVWLGATTIDSPVWIPRGSTFSMLHTCNHQENGSLTRIHIKLEFNTVQKFNYEESLNADL